MSHEKEALRELTDCPICLESFTDPRLLPCLHSLCCPCLDDHITHSGRNDQFLCPVCRKDLQIPSAGAQDFPRNFFMTSCVAIVKNTGTGARSKTGQIPRSEIQSARESKCSNDDGEGDCTEPQRFCLVCCEYYCKGCARIHQKQRATRSHELVAAEELTDEMLKAAMSKAEVLKCQKHSEELKLYCRECKCAVCFLCCHTGHKSHHFQEVSEVDEQAKVELTEILQAVQTLTSTVNEQIDTVKEALENLNNNTSTAQEITSSTFQKMQQILTKKDTEIKDKLSQVKEEGGATAGILTKNLTLTMQQLESLQTFIQDVMDNGTVFNRLACLPEIRSRLQKMQSSVEESAEDANDIVMPSSTELLLNDLDGLLLQQPVKLGSDGETAPMIHLLIECCSGNEKVRRAMKTTVNADKLSSIHWTGILFNWVVLGGLVCLLVCFSQELTEGYRALLEKAS